MKPTHLFRFTLLLLLGFNFLFANAAPGGSVMGQVIDPVNKEPIEGANVVFESQGIQRVFTTDQGGNYYASNIPAGVYTVTVSFMSKLVKVPDVKVINDEQAALNIPFSTAIEMTETIILFERDPIINVFNPTIEKLDKGAIAVMPITSVSDIQASIGGNTLSFNGEYYVAGARAGGLSYYLDGSHLMGSPNVPASSLDSYRSYTHFIPAKYGDTTGGLVVMETRSYFTE